MSDAPRTGRYRIAIVHIIPSALHQLTRHPDFRPALFASVLVVGSGAAYLPPQLVQQFKSLMRREIHVGQGESPGACSCTILPR